MKRGLYDNNLHNYVFSIFKSTEEKELLNSLIKNTHAYIFGGVIKDFYFNTNKSNRDVDIVLEEINPKILNALRKYSPKINQFGGYKLVVNGTKYDIWELKKTWYFLQNNSIDFFLNKLLPSTVFFNITAALYSLNECKLITHREFDNALKSNRLDVINPLNPFPELCILKAYEYKKKLNLKIGKDLRGYLLKYYEKKRDLIQDVQIKHYGQIQYSYEEIDSFILSLNKPKIENKTKESTKREIRSVISYKDRSIQISAL